jgi:hypothetical protein
MFLEEAVSRESAQDDEQFDCIMPYMLSTHPLLAFANSYTQDTPEFYLDYPIFIDAEEFVDEEYHTVYRVFDPSQEDTSPEIHILPENSVYTLFSEILDVIIYYVRVKDGKKIYEEVVQDFTLRESDYFINNVTGTFILLDDTFNLMREKQVLKDAGKEQEGFSSFYVFEFHIEKYRSVDDTKQMTTEEVDNIATMQDILITNSIIMKPKKKIILYDSRLIRIRRNLRLILELAYRSELSLHSKLNQKFQKMRERKELIGLHEDELDLAKRDRDPMKAHAESILTCASGAGCWSERNCKSREESLKVRLERDMVWAPWMGGWICLECYNYYCIGHAHLVEKQECDFEEDERLQELIKKHLSE